MAKNGNHKSTRALATKLVIGVFVLSFFILTCTVAYCVWSKAHGGTAEMPVEIYMAMLTSMTGLASTITVFYFFKDSVSGNGVTPPPIPPPTS